MSEVLVGVDVGGTRIKAVSLDRAASTQGRPLVERVLPTPTGLGGRLGEVLTEVVAAVLPEDTTLAAVGVAVPGLVDERRGMACYSANLGWEDLAARDLAEEALGVPVALGHDVRSGLVGEARYGAARGCQDVLFVPLGTGVAGALLSGGELVLGTEWTGEIGHVVVDPGGPVCGCGAEGCMEAVAGARGLGARWTARTGRRGGAAEVAAEVAAGDPVATELWQEAVGALTRVTAPVLAGAGSRMLLLGGGMSNAGETLTVPVREQLAALLPRRSVEVRIAALGDRAAALGAAALAADRLQRADRHDLERQDSP